MPYKIIIILGFIYAGFAPCHASAQAPVMDDDWLPVSGNKYYKYPIPAFPLGAPHGKATDTGENVIWDYTDSIYMGYNASGVYDFAVPYTRGISCTYNASNLASGNYTYHDCYLRNQNGLYATGSKQYEGPPHVNTFTTKYSKPELLMKNNFHFKDNVIDTSRDSYNSLVDKADSDYHETRIKKMKYDGYGTLKFGGLTFDSVIRIYSYSYVWDTVYTGGRTSIFHTKIHKYEWYYKARHVPILSLSTYYSLDSPKDTNFYMFYTLTAKDNTSIPPILNYLNTTTWFAGGQIMIKGNIQEGTQCSLYDTQGKLIISGTPEKTGDKWILKTGNIIPGAYLFKMDSKRGTQGSVKLVKTSNE